MDVPAVTHGYENGWQGYAGWPEGAHLTSTPGAFPSSPPAEFHAQYQGLHNGPVGAAPEVPPPFCGTGRTALPSVRSQRQPAWAPSPPCINGLFNGLHLDSSNYSHLPAGGCPYLDHSVSSPSCESRYGLDPKLLPSAVQIMQDDKAEWEGKVFASEPTGPLPPLATTDCLMEDRGSASPHFIRCTSYAFPSQAAAAQQSHLPLGAIVAPLARLKETECPLPVCVAAMDKGHIPGCGVCGAHMCPFMAWQDCGQRFCCPFCGNLNEVPWQSYQPTGCQGKRVDSEENPELSWGSYEVLEMQKGQPPGLLLAVDVSSAAVRGGQLELVCQQLRMLLGFLTRDEAGDQSDLRLGLMTYDRKVHLYDLSPTLSRPHMMVVMDTEELELPVWAGLLVPLRDCRDSLDSVLQQVPRLAMEAEDNPGSQELPIRAALRIFQALGCPGKLLVFHAAPPSDVTLTRGPSGFLRSAKPKSVFQPPDACISLAKECVSQGCSVHLFLFSQQDVGSAWPGHTTHFTGGGFFPYNGLQSEVDREQLNRDLRRCVETNTAYKAQLRVFVSKGLRVSGCYGAFIPGPDPTHVSMTALDGSTALALEFSHDGPLDDRRGVVIQAALSYTNAKGERRTQIHSLGVNCSNDLLDTFRSCQAQTLLTFYCKKMYARALERPPQELREELQVEVTRALACYRKHCCSSVVTHGQLVLPQFLKAFPVYLNSLRKSEVLLPGLRSSIPQRLQLRSRLVSMDARSTALYFYPLLLQLPVPAEECADLAPAEPVRCSASSLDPAGLYLAHGPLVLLLWVGRCVSPGALRQLFNTTSFSLLPPGEACLPVLDTPLSVCVRSLIETLQSHAPYSLKLLVAKQGEVSEEVIQPLLVEDKSPNGGASYPDFLYHLHVNSMRLLL
ncbi:protein transport protein Sec24C isoform X1 [Paramormyrops kingsleyae]|uniref:protein transport protein Sec24C isoform X1 n=1 Tax=Paramormyrops kingsleyae TaxID=1676925 RepID=UPI003B96A936